MPDIVQSEAESVSFWHNLRVESRELLKIALPIIATCCLSFLMNVVDLAMVGHLGREELAGAALGNALFSAIVFPMTGAAMAFDTLFAQAFGARNYSLYGKWLQIGGIVLIIMTIPSVLLLLNAENLLLLMKMDPELSAQAAKFVILLVPGVYPMVIFTVLTKYLQSQHILSPSVVIAALANVLNVVFNYVLIYAAGLGFVGAPIATSVSRFVQLFLLVGYLYRSPTHCRTWPNFKLDSFRSLERSRFKEFSVLGFMGFVMIALEAWAFDMSAILAAYLGTVPLAAHSSLLNVCGFMYMSFPLALSISISIRVGNLLGAGDSKAARSSANAGICITLAVAISSALILLTARSELGKLFSEDQAVVVLVASIVPIVALFQVFDCTQSLIAGVLRGMGRQSLVASLNFFGFWGIGLSVGAALTFAVGGPEGTGIGVFGLWLGLASGLGSTSLVGFAVLFWWIDWERQAREAMERSKHGGDVADELGPGVQLQDSMESV